MARFIGVAAMVVLGVWLVLPSRNWAGFPAHETLRGECANATAGVLRLYVGSGGATVGPWYSVTLRRPGLFVREKQIFYSYGEPAVESIRCVDDAVVLENSTRVIRLDYSRASTELTAGPLLYFDGELSPPFMQPVRVVMLTMGWLILACAVFSGIRTFRRNRVDPPPQGA
jgi:hypothetical protein